MQLYKLFSDGIDTGVIIYGEPSNIIGNLSYIECEKMGVAEKYWGGIPSLVEYDIEEIFFEVLNEEIEKELIREFVPKYREDKMNKLYEDNKDLFDKFKK